MTALQLNTSLLAHYRPVPRVGILHRQVSNQRREEE